MKQHPDRHDYKAEWMSQKRLSTRTVSIPEPSQAAKNRRKKYHHDLLRWLLYYRAAEYTKPFSEDHERYVAKLETAILHGGLLAIGMPRGFGKTTIAADAAVWGTLEGHLSYVAIIAKSAEAAHDIVDAAKTELESNDRLCRDYAEVCVPIRALEGIANRASSQVAAKVDANGQPTGEPARTKMSWKRDHITLPTVEGSRSSGAILKALGIKGRIRGLNHRRTDGTTVRPSLVILDDAQDDEIAASSKQVEKLERTITNSVLGTGGHHSPISAVAAMTVIQRGDLADRLLDTKLHPEWQGERTQMLYVTPSEWQKDGGGLWDEYKTMRQESLRNGNEGREATDFYSKHREKMDAGARVAWDACFDESSELSALQHAMNLLIDRGPEYFAAECQNDPLETTPTVYDLPVETVCSRLGNFKRHHAPEQIHWITGGIDINPRSAGLSWVVLAVTQERAGFVLDYGIYPEGKNKALYDAKNPGTETEEQAIFTGLHTLCKRLDSIEFMKGEDPVKPDLILIDAGHKPDTVFQFCRAANFQFRTLASKGRAAKYYGEKKAVGRPGDHCHLQSWANKGRVLIHNADQWRMNTQKAFLLPPGAPGSISLYGEKPEIHKDFAQQICGERLLETAETDKGTVFYNWMLTPGVPNDLLDALVMAYTGSSYLGASPLPGGTGQPKKKRMRRPKTVGTSPQYRQLQREGFSL